MIKAYLTAMAMLLFLVFSVGAQAKLYKWVDENGETHYGEVLPPGYATQDSVQIDKGMEVKQSQPKAQAPAKAKVNDEAAQEQDRRDQALLGSFSSEQEIDLARDRNLQQVNARTNSIKMRLQSAQDDLASYQKEQDGLTKSGRPADKMLQDQIDQTSDRVKKLQDELAQSLAEADSIRARYDADKKRYHELTTGAGK